MVLAAGEVSCFLSFESRNKHKMLFCKMLKNDCSIEAFGPALFQGIYSICGGHIFDGIFVFDFQNCWSCL